MAATTHRQIPEIGPGELRISIREHGTTTTLELEGEWDLANRQTSLAAVTEALARRPECLLFDLSQVSFIDPSGIHAVLETSTRCAELETHLVIVPGPRAVQRLFDLCGLTEKLNFAPDGSQARKRKTLQRRNVAAGPGGSVSLPAAQLDNPGDALAHDGRFWPRQADA